VQCSQPELFFIGGKTREVTTLQTLKREFGLLGDTII